MIALKLAKDHPVPAAIAVGGVLVVGLVLVNRAGKKCAGCQRRKAKLRSVGLWPQGDQQEEAS